MTDQELLKALEPIQERVRELQRAADQLLSATKQVSNDLNLIWSTWTHKTDSPAKPAKAAAKTLKRVTRA